MTEHRDAQTLTAYKAAFAELREQLTVFLGKDTVDLLTQRAIREIDATYPAVKDIKIGAEGLVLASLDVALQGMTDQEIGAAFYAMTAVMLLILGRLLGRHVSETIARELDDNVLIKGVGGGAWH